MLNRILNRSTRYHEWLLPYLEGGLDEARQAQLEARLAADPSLAAEAERLRQTLGGLQTVSARTPRPENAQVPADLWPHLRARLVLEPAPRPRARAWVLAGVGAPAAAALIVAAFWLPGWRTPIQPTPSPKPASRSGAAPSSPKPALLPAKSTAGLPASPAKLQPIAKPNVAATPPPPSSSGLTHADPFALPIPASAVNKSGKSPLEVPAAPILPSRLTVRPASPPAPPVQDVTAAHGDAKTRVAVPATAVSAPQLAPIQPKALPAPTPAPLAAIGQVASPPTVAQKANAGLGGGAGFGGGGAGLAPAAVPKGNGGNLDGNTQPQAKPPVNVPVQPPAAKSGEAGQPLRDMRRNKMPQRLAAPGAPANGFQAFGANPQASLDSWQASLSTALQAPLWGETAGEQQANLALMAARESGMLDDLRDRLEARRASSPHDLVTGRMLAAVYDFGFSTEPALREHRRVVGLEGAGGEDWYALAQAEEHARNTTAARTAYRRALESPIPPSPFHAAIARGRI